MENLLQKQALDFKIQVFWDINLCRLLKNYGRFKG
jgi:hypothetical protein